MSEVRVAPPTGGLWVPNVVISIIVVTTKITWLLFVMMCISLRISHHLA